jgi:energy-coupling factor transporter ATP-binding protein EcfA2
MVVDLFEKISLALANNFVQSDKVARIIALAVKSKKNVLLWGPGGHGKSEMVTLALAQVTSKENIFVQTFGEGMDEARLFGGLNFKLLEEEKILQYYPERSFLGKEIAVFEEMFDAPPVVLMSLKDTLTARELRNGAQSFAMETKVIIAITNRDPSEIADMGPAAAALVERFPLQLKVEWPSYKPADDLEHFDKVSARLEGAELNGTMPVLAEVMAKASESGSVISPRTAVHALGIAKTAAALRGSDKVEQQDLLDLCFLPGMEAFASTLKAELDAAYDRSQAEILLQRAEFIYGALMQELKEAGVSPIKLLQVAKKLIQFQDEVSALKVTDGLTDRRKALRDSAAAKVVEIQKSALDNTRIETISMKEVIEGVPA